MTDLKELKRLAQAATPEVGSANAAYIAAANPDVMLKLLAVVEAARDVNDDSGIRHALRDSIWDDKALRDLCDALDELEKP